MALSSLCTVGTVNIYFHVPIKRKESQASNFLTKVLDKLHLMIFSHILYAIEHKNPLLYSAIYNINLITYTCN